MFWQNMNELWRILQHLENEEINGDWTRKKRTRIAMRTQEKQEYEREIKREREKIKSRESSSVRLCFREIERRKRRKGRKNGSIRWI